MKLNKFPPQYFLILITTVFLFLGCKKEEHFTIPEQAVTISKNLIIFKSVQIYESNAALKDKTALYDMITNSDFTSLGKKLQSAIPKEDPTNITPNSSSINATPTGDDEDIESLYPNYLLNILNTDSIVQIGNYLFKIDLVNQKGLVLSSSYASEYNDLKNNNLSNTHIMSFDNDDDIFEALEWIEHQNGSYSNYIEQKNGLRIPILCFDKGAKDGKEKEYIYWDNERPNYRLKCELTYQKAIIYFRLIADQKTQKRTWYGIWRRDCQNVEIRMDTYFKWVQRCKRLENSGERGTDYDFCQNTRVAYEGAKGLRSYYMDALYNARFIEDGALSPWYQSRVFHIEFLR